jgi:hypothetical protein
MNMSRDTALVFLTEEDDGKYFGKVIACGGPIKNDRGDCAFEIEQNYSSCINDLNIDEHFEGMPVPSLVIWEGEITYCATNWHGDVQCDCGPEMQCTFVRLATPEDLKSFGIHIGGSSGSK